MRRIGGESGGGERPLTRQDDIITFSESGVSLDGIGFSADSGDIAISPGDTLDLGSTNGFTTVGESGIIIRPQVDVEGLQATVAPDTDTFDGVIVNEWTDQDGNGATVVEGGDGSAGGTIDLSGGTLNAGEKYAIIAYSQQDFGTGKGAFPSDTLSDAGSLEFVDGYVDATTDGTEWYTFDTLNFTLADSDSTEVTIQLQDPPDVEEWDIASFRSTPDGGSVDVYMEASTDGGATWTEVQGPIQRGEQITASADSQTRFRVELSRPGEASDPRLRSVYRRWVV